MKLIQSGRGRHAWFLLNFALWWKEFIEGKSSPDSARGRSSGCQPVASISGCLRHDWTVRQQRISMRNASLACSLVLALCLATLTLWIPAYWPVALFEISVFLIASIAVVLGRVPVERNALTRCSH